MLLASADQVRGFTDSRGWIHAKAPEIRRPAHGDNSEIVENEGVALDAGFRQPMTSWMDTISGLGSNEPRLSSNKCAYHYVQVQKMCKVVCVLVHVNIVTSLNLVM